jgi:hypothetical protein
VLRFSRRRLSRKGSEELKLATLPGRFRPQLRDKNRRGIGKSQPIWTDSKMETVGSQIDVRAHGVALDGTGFLRPNAARKRACTHGY